MNMIVPLNVVSVILDHTVECEVVVSFVATFKIWSV